MDDHNDDNDDDNAFTLIELLVVVVILGILIAIAIPVYLNYENGARNRSAASDVRNAIAVVEQCHDDTGAWPPDISAATNNALACTGRRINLSPDNTLTYTAPTSSAKFYVITVANSNTGKSYTYDSSSGHITSP